MPASPSPPLSYTKPPALDAFSSTPDVFRSTHPPIEHLIAGALVTNPQGQILLLRRAAHDSWPLLWEVPGGCVDHSDDDLVAAAVRELWEEAGLRAKAVKAIVGIVPTTEPMPDDPLEKDLEVLYDMLVFRADDGVWGKLTVWVEVESCDDVKIDENEHVEFAWVTEEEAIKNQFKDGKKLEFVSEGVKRNVLQGFRLWKQENEATM
ncbi:nudix protein [Fusarium austroafricanum]|uniref:Nudix protein n=1 Tax=Fusarium austroafricanum TaxID=2364996 RepID=A0A8H4P6R4_9HYPO|nr:nudix protein [Fusarium austroafricanum]